MCVFLEVLETYCLRAKKKFKMKFGTSQQIGHHTEKISDEKRCCSTNVNGNNNITMKQLAQKSNVENSDGNQL